LAAGDPRRDRQSWADAPDAGPARADAQKKSGRAEEQDRRDVLSLYETLEQQVVPLYYERDEAGVPHGWVERMKRTIRTLGWRFNTDRMVIDYARESYLPAAGAQSCAMPK
jgi:starch phosphorylase